LYNQECNRTLTGISSRRRSGHRSIITSRPCDYPETSATWVALGREAGFADAREIFCDPTDFYRIYRYDC
jgi:hypothetical protein